MDKKTFSYGFLIFFLFVTIYIYMNNDSVASIIAGNGFNGIFWYILTNPAYILIIITIFMLNREAGVLKNILGGFMLIFAMDIVSMPRFSPAGLSQDLGLLASSDGIFFNWFLSHGLTFSSAYTLYYLILPILLILGALAILGIHNFYRQLMGQR